MLRARTKGWLVVVGVVLLTTVACHRDMTYQGTTGPKVAIAGDVAVDASADALHAGLDASARVRILSADTATTSQLRGAAAEAAADGPDIVVFSGGTNDVLQHVATADTLANFDDMLSRFPSTCTVAINVNTHATAAGFSSSAATAINDGLRERVDELIDWNARVGADPDGMTQAPDHLVPTAAGQAAIVAQVTEAINRCQQHPASDTGNRRASYGNNFTAGCHDVTTCPIDGNGQPQPGFWAAVSYPYAGHQAGDPLASRCWGDSASATACTSPPVFDNLKNTGSPTNAIAPNPAPPFGDPTWNPEYRPDGYLYAVNVTAPGTVTVELYDASCDTDSSDTFADFNCAGQTPTDYQLYNTTGNVHAVNAKPGNEVAGCRKTVVTNDAGYRNRWTTLCTFTATTPGTYPLRVRTDDIPAAAGFAGCPFTDVRTPSGCTGNGVNSFALRASGPAGLTVSPLRDGSMWLDPGRAIYLADVEPSAAGKVLQIDVFDPGDGSAGSTPPIAAYSVSEPNPTTGSELGAQPVPACRFNGANVRGGPSTQGASLSLCSITTFDNTVPFSKFNNQWLRITVPIPSTYTCPAAADACWWRLAYNGPMTDRMTYSVRITGDVVP